MRNQVLVLILISTLLLTACNAGNNNSINVKTPPTTNVKVENKEERPNFTKETFPKVDGSTATIPLSQAIASNLLSITKEESVKFIKHNTTHNAYVNLLDKKADIIFVTEPSTEELNMAKDSKLELEIVPVVKEGFVFLVNTSNPIKTLTTKQIQDIYEGKIKNWKEVGGEDKGIIAYQREANSGSQTLMEKLVMKGNKLADSPKTIINGMEGLIESIAKYDNSDKALGYSVFYYAKTMYNKDTIKLLAINGITPNNDNISSGKYPFTTSYYAVLRKSEPNDSNARKLLAWLTGADGQKLTEAAGYVPLEAR